MRCLSAAEKPAGSFSIGPPQRAVARLVDDVLVELRQHLLHQDARLHDALLHPLAHVLDRLVEHDRHLTGAADPCVVVGDRRERLRVGARPEDGDPVGQIVELVDRYQVRRVLEAFELHLLAADEDVVGQPMLAPQAVAADRARAVQVAPVQIAHALAMLRRQEVGKLVVVARVADLGRLDRLEHQIFLPERGVQLGEPGLGSGLGARRRALPGSRRIGGGRRSRGPSAGKEGEDDS